MARSARDFLHEMAAKVMVSMIEPLDGDQTELLADAFQVELDFLNGNITEEERQNGCERTEDVETLPWSANAIRRPEKPIQQERAAKRT